jgi:FAD/FMN-containing dehydrogenase
MAWLVYYGGEFQRVATTATAYAHRDAPFEMGISARWQTTEDGAAHIAWADTFWAQIAPFASGGVYSNWSSNTTADSSAAAYGVNLARLQELKSKYDPLNVFDQNFNVLPTRA